MYKWHNTNASNLLHYYRGCANSAREQNDTKEYKKYQKLIAEIESRESKNKDG